MIGCGHMGTALLRGFMARRQDVAFTIIKPSPLPQDLQAIGNIEHTSEIGTASDSIANTQMLLLAIKPQILPDILSAISPDIKPETLITSIAAGTNIETIEGLTGASQPIIRVMPNTPALLGKAMHVACANKQVSSIHKQWVESFFEASGKFTWIDDEKLMNAVTALSGSGPAYIFYLIDVLAKAGMNNGLPEDLANMLARQTIIGSAALAKDQSDKSAEALRAEVTSPGGTTQAALDILMNGEMQSIFDKALKAAVTRGDQLSKSK